MNNLMQQSKQFRRAAEIRAETPITAGPPMVKKWWVRRAEFLPAVTTNLDDIIREVCGMELTRYTNCGERITPTQERQTYEYDTKAEAIAAARDLYKKDVAQASAHGQGGLVEKAQAGLRILERA